MTDSIIARGSSPSSDTNLRAKKPSREPQEFSSGPPIPGLDDMPATRVNPETGEEELPTYDPRDPASLEAFFGNFGYAEHFRKVVLANAREAARAKATRDEVKVTEARLDDQARTSDMYVNFLVHNLQGRTLRERNVIDSNQQSGR